MSLSSSGRNHQQQNVLLESCNSRLVNTFGMHDGVPCAINLLNVWDTSLHERHVVDLVKKTDGISDISQLSVIWIFMRANSMTFSLQQPCAEVCV